MRRDVGIALHARVVARGFIVVKKNLRTHEPADMISLLSDVGP